MKVQMSLSEELVARADKYAKSNYLSRSAVVSIALNQFLTSCDMVSYLQDMSLAMRRIADEGKVDADTIKQLEDFERLAKILSSGNSVFNK